MPPHANDKEIHLFFIGSDFYGKSASEMSSIYYEDFQRCDWGFVEVHLEQGQPVHIRPATPDEMKWATEKLQAIRLQNKQYFEGRDT